MQEKIKGLFDWLKKIKKEVKELNKSVDTYKKETDNQAIPSLAYVNRAKKLIDSGKYEDAKNMLTQALMITDKDSITYKYLGICEEKLGNIESAIENYKKSAYINESDKIIWYKLGMAQITLKRYEEAEKSFEQAHKVTPVNTDVETGWGMTFLKQKKYMEAHEKFVNAIKINRYNFSAMLLCAIVEVRLKQYDDAYAKLSFLIKTNPTEACMYEFANLNFLKDNYEDAIRYATYSLEYNSNMLPAYLLLGKTYSIKQDYEKSVKYFITAEEKGLTNEALYTEWGLSMLRLYKFDDAKIAFEKALSENSESTDAKIGLILSNNELGFDLEDIELSDNVYSYEAKGVYLMKTGDYEGAVDLFKQALEKDSNLVYNYYRLAKCYEKINNSTMIEDCYDKLNKFAQNFLPGYIDYAKYLMDKKDYKNAQRKLRKAEKLSPDNQQVLNMLFNVSYILVKDDICEYNVKEVLALADRIENFESPELKADLEGILKNLKQ